MNNAKKARQIIYSLFLFTTVALAQNGVSTRGPPYCFRDVFRMFLDDFFGLLGLFKPNFTPDPKKVFIFVPCEGLLRGSQNCPQEAKNRPQAS